MTRQITDWSELPNFGNNEALTGYYQLGRVAVMLLTEIESFREKTTAIQNRKAFDDMLSAKIAKLTKLRAAFNYSWEIKMTRIIVKDENGSILTMIFVPDGEIIVKERNGVTVNTDKDD